MAKLQSRNEGKLTLGFEKQKINQLEIIVSNLQAQTDEMKGELKRKNALYNAISPKIDFLTGVDSRSHQMDPLEIAISVIHAVAADLRLTGPQVKELQSFIRKKVVPHVDRSKIEQVAKLTEVVLF